jgi:hypothetical protein
MHQPHPVMHRQKNNSGIFFLPQMIEGKVLA